MDKSVIAIWRVIQLLESAFNQMEVSCIAKTLVFKVFTKIHVLMHAQLIIINTSMVALCNAQSEQWKVALVVVELRVYHAELLKRMIVPEDTLHNSRITRKRFRTVLDTLILRHLLGAHRITNYPVVGLNRAAWINVQQIHISMVLNVRLHLQRTNVRNQQTSTKAIRAITYTWIRIMYALKCVLTVST